MTVLRLSALFAFVALSLAARGADIVGQTAGAATDAQRRENAAETGKDRAQSTATRGAKSNKPPSGSKARNASKESACEREKRQYRQSQECFARYRNPRGGIKPEGVKRCVEMKEPDC